MTEFKQEWIEQPGILSIVNDGPKLRDTNYWQTEPAKRGFYYLTTNAGCIRLLVPAGQEHNLAEMTKPAREVILTRGRYLGRDDFVEIMFEDMSEAPFAVHLSPPQMDRRWVRDDQDIQWRFAIYTEHGMVAEFTRCYLRQGRGLPCMLKWQGSYPRKQPTSAPLP